MKEAKKGLSLLDKSNSVKKNRSKRTEEDVELALAWAKGEISITAVAIAKGFTATSTCYQYLALTFKSYFSNSYTKK